MNARFVPHMDNVARFEYLGCVRLVEHGVGRDKEADYDLYVVDGPMGVDVVARYGNRPDQYYSGIHRSYGEFASLTKARQLAHAKVGLKYDVYQALDILVGDPEVHNEVNETQQECLHELVTKLKDSEEMQTFTSFRNRDLNATKEHLNRLVEDAEARGVRGSVGFKLRMIYNNILRISSIVAALEELKVNTVSVVTALSYRAPKMVA